MALLKGILIFKWLYSKGFLSSNSSTLRDLVPELLCSGGILPSKCSTPGEFYLKMALLKGTVILEWLYSKGFWFPNGSALKDLVFRFALFWGDSAFEVLYFRGIYHRIALLKGISILE